MFHHPPPPRQRELTEADLGAVQREAERQAGSFYPYMGAEHYKRTVAMIAYGTTQMVLRGAGRVQDDGTVLFWHPGEGEFVVYDHAYNNYMLGFLRACTAPVGA
jgi:hypothetical protein